MTCCVCLAVTLLWIGHQRIHADERPVGQENTTTGAVLEKKGYVVPLRSVLVVPEVSGRVIAMHFEEGKRVKKGDLLVELDPTPYALEYRRAAALAEVATARLQESLRRKDGEAVSRAELAAAELAREGAKYRLDATKILAPSDGIIISKETEEGCVVDRQHFNGNYAVCRIMNPARMDVEVWVEERDIHRIAPGQKCAIRTEAFPNKVYKGEVTRVGPVADRARSAIPVRIRVEAPKQNNGLLPEFGAVVSFLTKG